MWHEGVFISTNDHENPRSSVIYTQETVRDGTDGHETNCVDTVGLVTNVAIRQVSCSTAYRKSLSVVILHRRIGLLFTTTRCILDNDPTLSPNMWFLWLPYVYGIDCNLLLLHIHLSIEVSIFNSSHHMGTNVCFCIASARNLQSSENI